MPLNFERQDNKTLFDSDEEMDRRGLTRDSEHSLERVVYVEGRRRRTFGEWLSDKGKGIKSRVVDVVNSGERGSILDIFRIIIESVIQAVKGAFFAIQALVDTRGEKKNKEELSKYDDDYK